jgi:restriction system protein
MSVPTYDQFIEPVLRYLAAHPEGALARDVHEAAAEALHLTDAQRSEMVPSRAQRVYKNRAGWAHDRLKRAGLSVSLRRGLWQLTERGRAFADAHPIRLSPETVEELATEYNDVRLQPGTAPEPVASELTQLPVLERATVSPDDRLEQAMAELRQTVTAELLEMLSQVSPEYFETVVLDLLHKMGYGTNRNDLLRVGRTGDGGIDGVISLDRLGLEKVYVQAKRWQGSVGRPDVQGFYGALAGQRATKGVFITTSTFTQQAVEFAGSVERIVLVDGRKLADLMIEHEVGVTLRSLRVAKIDMDYFEE